MPGTVIGKSMGEGYPGSYSRNGDCIIASKLVTSTDATGPNFGDPVMQISTAAPGTYTSAAVGYAAFATTNFAGIAVREIKSFETYTAPTLGNYAPGMPCDVLQRGSIMVVVTRGTAPLPGGAVYVRTVLGSSPDAGAVVGGIESSVPADGGTSVTLPNAKFTTGLTSTDANGYVIAEITLLTRNLP